VRQPSFSICAFIAAAVLYSIPAHAAGKSPVEVIEDHSFFIEKAYNHLVQTVYPARRIQSCRDFWSDHSEFIDRRSDSVTHSGSDFWSPHLFSQSGQ
jgi:hypothetical protein